MYIRLLSVALRLVHISVLTEFGLFSVYLVQLLDFIYAHRVSITAVHLLIRKREQYRLLIPFLILSNFWNISLKQAVNSFVEMVSPCLTPFLIGILHGFCMELDGYCHIFGYL